MALCVRETLVIDTVQSVDGAEVTGLRQEHAVVDEPPQRQERVDAAGFLVIASNPRQPHHHRISTSKRMCLPGSYRRRDCDEFSRIRSIWGSRRVAHNAKT